MFRVEIDSDAGLCSGVKKAVLMAEKALEGEDALLCLGEIVHNEAETERLRKMGLETIDNEIFDELHNKKILIRTHGEPPETYEKAISNNIELMDATCPVVLRLQQKVRKVWEAGFEKGVQVVIAGKKNHPEVISLNGQTNYASIVIENETDLARIDPAKPVELFAQTTFSKVKYAELVRQIAAMMSRKGNKDGLKVHHTICGQVANRVPKLKEFCSRYDVILFVAGKNSSNGKALFETCRQSNKNAYHISTHDEIDRAWIRDAENIGISGATSTPVWQMEAVRNAIMDLNR
jgi:4-hydroxy-3-methylbut-2-en-1-yl diphosphate reductase